MLELAKLQMKLEVGFIRTVEMFFNSIFDHLSLVDQTIVGQVFVLWRFLRPALVVPLFEERLEQCVVDSKAKKFLGHRQFQRGGIVFFSEPSHQTAHVLAHIAETFCAEQQWVLSQSKFVVVDYLFKKEKG